MTDVATHELEKRDIRRRRSLLAQTVIRLFGRTGAVVGLAWVGFTALLAVCAPLLANSAPLAWKVVGEDGQTSWAFPLFQLLTPQDVMLLVGFLLAAGLGCCYRAGGKLFWVWLAPMCVTIICAALFIALSDLGNARNVLDNAQDNLQQAITTDETLGPYQKAVSTALWDVTAWWLMHTTAPLFLAGGFALAIFKLRRNLTWLVTTLALSVMIAAALLSPQLRVEKSSPAYDTYRLATLEGKVEKAYYTLIPYSPLDGLRNPQVTPIKPNNLSPGTHPRIPDIAAEMKSYMEGKGGYNARLAELDQAEGREATILNTIEDAYAAADRLWQAHQKQPTYNPVAGRILNEKVQTRLDELAATPVRTRYHLMGTTGYGQDLASRMIHGARIALVIGFIATGIAVIIGVIIGGLLGYFAGWVDLIGLRLVEIFASIPVIMLLIMIVAFYGRSLTLMMVVLGLTGWVGYAYFVRAEFLKLRNMDYVMAARATGTPLYLILFRHMLPNGVAPVLVGASFGIAGAIMTEATLSFLGLGLIEEPSWGQMLNQAREGGAFDWWLAIFPGSAIFLTVFAYNLIGEALRDVIDPRAMK